MRSHNEAPARMMRNAFLFAALSAVGCGVPNSIVLRGSVDEDAVRDVWFTHDGERLVIQTPAEFLVVDVGGRTGGPAGASAGGEVWISPVSDHLVEADRAAGRARLCDLQTATWTDWFAIAAGEGLPDGAATGEGLRIPTAGETWPADAAAFWVACAAGRLPGADGKPLSEAAVRTRWEAYRAARGSFRLIRWSRPGRPLAPSELDSPRRRWRVHLQPVWSSGVRRLLSPDRYVVDVVVEDLRTGRKRPLIDSSGDL